MIPAQRERHALADLFDDVGPDAPTLCEGWRARDLAAHLVARERRPDASVGLVVPGLSGYTERVQTSIRDGQPWGQLVQRVRTGPPFPLSLPPVDANFNTGEYFVHHEDVRRAGADAGPRALDADLEALLWSRMSLMGRLLARRVPVGLRIESSRGSHTVKGGEPVVTVRGDPGELVLWLFGRATVAQVELRGPADAKKKVAGARLGL